MPKRLLIHFLFLFSLFCFAQEETTTIQISEPPINEEYILKNTSNILEGIPKFMGEDTLLHFLYKNINYPLIAIEEGITGRVIVRFIVEKDGTLSNFFIERGIGGGCDQESVRVLKLTSGRWTPGYYNGEPVRTSMIQPIMFKML